MYFQPSVKVRWCIKKPIEAMLSACVAKWDIRWFRASTSEPRTFTKKSPRSGVALRGLLRERCGNLDRSDTTSIQVVL